jgi:hypothetical protein
LAINQLIKAPQIWESPKGPFHTRW